MNFTEYYFNSHLISSVNTYLHTTVFLIGHKVHSIYAVADGVTSHPLICILPSLSGHTFYTHQLHKVHLKPLSYSSEPHAPRPAVVQSAMPGGKMMVVVSGGREVTIWYTLVLQTKWHGTTI